MRRAPHRSGMPAASRVGIGLLLLATVGGSLLGCDDSPASAGGGGVVVGTPTPSPSPSPTPTPTETPVPAGTTTDRDGSEVDPRCVAMYPEVDLEPTYEGEIPLRPHLWPAAPDSAALCFWEQDSDTSSIAYFATDIDLARAELFRHYERAFGDRAEHWRMDGGELGEILTGVHAPEHSFYIEFMSRGRYQINWGIDGDYGV